MDKRSKVAEPRSGRGSGRKTSPSVAQRTRSKSPARVEKSGRDSAAIKRRGRPKKTDTPAEEVSSGSQSSTPKKEIKKKSRAEMLMDDSGDNEEVSEINDKGTRRGLRDRKPVIYKYTPTPPEDKTRKSLSRPLSTMSENLTNENSEDEDEEEDNEEVEIIPTNHADPLSFGFFAKPWVVFLLLESLLLMPIILHLASNRPWNLSKVLGDLQIPATYCSTQAGSFFLAFLSGTVLLSFVPLYRDVKLPGSEEHMKFNGIFTAVAILAFLFGLELKGLDALTAIYNNIDRLLFLSIFTNLIIAGALYVRGKRSPPVHPNPFGTSGRFINDFAAGLEINPKIYKRLDVKSICYIRSVVLLLVINVAILFKNITIPVIQASSGAPISELVKETYTNLVFIIRHSEYNAASFVVSGLLVLYALDLLIFEHHLAASFQLNTEGLGAEVLLRFATFPFLLSILPRFLLKEKLQINCYLLTVICVVFIVGLAIKRCSNCLKYEYRLRPLDAKFKDLKTLPTFQSHRIIVSRWWSKIRQPNLFGEFLLHIVLLVPLTIKFNWPAFLGIAFIVGYLVYRSILINRRNAKKYETSWQRYTSIVKYNLLPRVY